MYSSEPERRWKWQISHVHARGIVIEMQWGVVGIVISIIVALYTLALWYVGTRALVRCLRNAPVRPICLEVTVKNKDS